MSGLSGLSGTANLHGSEPSRLAPARLTKCLIGLKDHHIKSQTQEFSERCGTTVAPGCRAERFVLQTPSGVVRNPAELADHSRRPTDNGSPST
jgi:hypothetical protein